MVPSQRAGNNSSSDRDDEEEVKKPVNSRKKPRASSMKTENKAAAPRAKNEKKELRKWERAHKDHLRKLHEKTAKKIDDFRKEVKIVYDSMIFDEEAFKAEYAGKRGVRRNQNYLEIALDNLENLYIIYYTTPKKEKGTDADKKER